MAKLKVADIALDVVYSQVIAQRQALAVESSPPIASATPVPTLPESPAVNTTQSSEVMTPHQPAVEVPSCHQTETDACLKPALLLSKMEDAEAIPASLPDSPTGITQSQGSETPTSIESVASEISEIRITPFDSPLTNEAMLTSPSGGEAVLESPAIASPPASLMGKALERIRQVPFTAMRLGDATVPDGQIFPPGAEFIKSWRMRNNGTQEWPSTTELVFTGGEAMTQDLTPVSIGSVKPGAEVEVSSQSLKAPELPGNYLSFWSLRTQGYVIFGDALWININVVEQSETSQDGLSSSSIMKMPESVLQAKHEELDDQVPSPTTTEQLTDEAISDKESLGSANISFDSCDWPGEPTEQEEYVILYDDSSSDGN
jgi:hypothetical protein